MKKQEQIFYLIIIIIFIGILSFRLSGQNQKISESLKRIRSEEHTFLPDMEDIRKEDREVEMNKFIAEDEDFSFEYSANWTELEDDDVLKIFQSPQAQENLADYEDYQQSIPDLETERLEDLSQITEIDSDPREVEGEPIFVAMKTRIPSFSIGVLSVKKMEGGKSVEDLKEEIISSLSYEDDKYKTEITNAQIGDYFISVEATTLIDNRPFFRSKNLALLSERNTYLMSFGSPIDNWNEMKTKFNKIISSVDLKK